MKLSSLSKEKRKELFGVAFFTVIALGVLGFGLIKWQYGKLEQAAGRRAEMEKKLREMQNLIKNADQIEANLAASSATLAHLEEAMANPRDPYIWVVNTIQNFSAAHNSVSVPAYSQPLTTDMDLLPKFPYKQVKVTVGGKAHYDKLGAFLAGFENRFPHIRLLNLTVEPAPGGAATDKDKEILDFRVDVACLLKPNPS